MTQEDAKISPNSRRQHVVHRGNAKSAVATRSASLRLTIGGPVRRTCSAVRRLVSREGAQDFVLENMCKIPALAFGIVDFYFILSTRPKMAVR
jgi:hypothetical protein